MYGMTATEQEPESDVADWATDFDHTDPGWAANAPAIWDDLRDRCPVAHSDRFGGVWLPTRHEDVRAIANDTEHFTSQSVIVSKRSAMKYWNSGGVTARNSASSSRDVVYGGSW